jgi:hypothetical protein
MKKVINNCLIQIRNLPLERFRVASSGRKWKNLARQLQAMLVWLAGFANGDGTFAKGDEDFSPSVKRQMKHFGYKRHWIYKLQDYLKALGFLTWTRVNRQEGRKYTITIPDVDDSPTSDVDDRSNPDVDDSKSEVDDRNPDVDAAWTSDVDSMRTPSATVLHTVIPSAATTNNSAKEEERFYFDPDYTCPDCGVHYVGHRCEGS